MRRFYSYGPINNKLHYYAPRKELIDRLCSKLIGEGPDSDGNYISVTAPWQTGKTWLMQEVVQKINKENEFEIGILSFNSAKQERNEEEVLSEFNRKMAEAFQQKFAAVDNIIDIPGLFTERYFQKPVILIIDEFDTMGKDFMNGFANIARNMYMDRRTERHKKSINKRVLLHGMALVGVTGSMEVQNVKGSPFNVQQFFHIPHLTYDEVKGMFQWYEKESKQRVEPEVIDRLYNETNGQPGLIGWFGELLTETYNKKKGQPITADNFEEVRQAAAYELPNQNASNIINRVKDSPYKEAVLDLFQTGNRIDFHFDNRDTNYLYMNGVAEMQSDNHNRHYLKFSSPFFQRRLFHHFSAEWFKEMSALAAPFTKSKDVITDTDLNILNLMKLYQSYVQKNNERLFKSVPRRMNTRIYDAVYYFNLFSYLEDFLKKLGGRVFLEFPGSNEQIELIITYAGKTYAVEIRSFSSILDYKIALKQAAEYGKQSGLKEISLAFFIESIDDENRKKYEANYRDEATGVTVIPIFVTTGN